MEVDTGAGDSLRLLLIVLFVLLVVVVIAVVVVVVLVQRRSREVPPSSMMAADQSVTERLAEVDALFHAGKISAVERDAARARILGSL